MFTPDTTPPVLEAANLADHHLYLTFSEPVVPASTVPSLLSLVAADGSGDSLDVNVPVINGANDAELVLDLGVHCNQGGHFDMQMSVHACEPSVNPNGTCGAVMCDLATTGVHSPELDTLFSIYLRY